MTLSETLVIDKAITLNSNGKTLAAESDVVIRMNHENAFLYASEGLNFVVSGKEGYQVSYSNGVYKLTQIPVVEIVEPKVEDVDKSDNISTEEVQEVVQQIIQNTAAQKTEGFDTAENTVKIEAKRDEVVKQLEVNNNIQVTEDTVVKTETVVSVSLTGIVANNETTGETTKEITSITFDVQPQVVVTVYDDEEVVATGKANISEFETKIKFRLPLPRNFTANFVNVYHKTDLMPGSPFAVEGSGDNRYVEVQSDSFSPYTVADADPVAIISGTDVKVFNLDDAFTDEVNPGKNAVIMVSDYTGDVTIESGFYSFYLNGHTMTGTFKLDGGTVQFYGNLNDSSNPGKIVNTGLDSKYAVWCSNGNFNIGSNVIIEATGENGVAAYSDGNKMIISGDVTVNGDVMTGGYGILEISNGTYNGSLIKAANTSLEVTGGKFSKDPSGFIPTGYTTKVENGYYNVVVDEITLDKLSQDNEGAYLIKTPDDVVIFRTLLNVSEGKNILSGKVFKLANDIDMADYTLPAAGSDSKRFMGTFDGQNHTISNINIEASNVNYVAFFGNISGATIKDLTLNNVTVVGGSYTAGLVGFTRNSTIENCAITGSISIAGTTHVGGIHAGGVVTIKDCEVNGTGTISGEWDVGGISGLISAGSTDISGNTVSGITVTSEIGYTGGIAGRVLVGDDKSITLADNAVNNVTITAKTAEYSSAILVGAMQTDKASVILDCNAASGATLTVAGEEKTNLYDTDCDNNSNVTITVPVAYIGDQGFKTLAQALTAAEAGETVTLLCDLALVDTITIAKSITLDGNGHKLTPADATKTYNSAIMAGDSGWGDDHGGTITLKNIVFDGWNTKHGVVRAQGVTLNVDTCEFKGCSVSNDAYGVLSLNFADAEVSKSEFVGNSGRAIDINYNGDKSNAVVTIDGCEFTGNTSTGAGIVVRNDGEKLVVKNSTFKNNVVNTNGNAATLYAGWGDADEITGNTFEDNTVTTSHATTKRFASAIFCDGCTVTGNVFSGNTATRAGSAVTTAVAVGAYYGAAEVSGNYWDSKIPTAGVDYTVEYSKYPVAVTTYCPTTDVTKTESTGYVAQVGKYSYETLPAAIAAAEAGDTVTLLSDVTLTELIKIEKAITIDLGGKKVTTDAQKAFEVYADATIKNGTIEAANRCVDTRKAVALTLTGVKLIADEYTTYGNPQPLTIGGSEHGTEVTMTNVTISAEAGYGIITFVKTDLTATNSTIGGYSALYVKPGSEGSTFEFVNTDLSGSTDDNDVAGNGFSTIAVRADNVTVNVDAESSVTATGNYCCAISLGGDYTGEETVTGAKVTVNGTITGNVLDASSLTGNTLAVKAEYADELSEDGYAHIVNNDGTITAAVAAASIGTTCYTSLQAAVDAAVEGDRITVLKSGEIALVKKAVVIDHNEFEVTVAALAGYAVVESNGVSTIIKSSDYMANAGDPIAYVDIDNDGYKGEVLTTLQAALNTAASGDTVKLTADLTIADATIIIPEGVTLDIQSYTVKVKNLIGLNGSFLRAQHESNVDGKMDGGKLVVAKNNLVLSEQAPKVDDVTASNGKVLGRYLLPIWSPSENCYRFARIFTDSLSSSEYGLVVTDDEISFKFRHQVNTDINKLLLNDGADDNAMSIVLRLEWNVYDGDGNLYGTAHQDFVYGNYLVSKVAVDGWRYTFNLKNYAAMGIAKDSVKVYAKIVSDSGATMFGHEW